MILIRPRPEPWRGVLLLSALILTAVDAVLLQIKYGAFTGGFLNPAYVDGIELPAFLLGSLWLDAAVTVVFVGPALWLTGRLRRRGHAHTLLLATLLCTLPVLTATALRFEGELYAGDAVQYVLPFLRALDTRLTGGIALLLGGALAAAAAWRVARRIPDRGVAWFFRPGKPRVLVVLLLGAPLLLAAAGHADDIDLQLGRKIAGRWITRIAEKVTDFDGDGAGLVARPPDPAPFDSRRYPFAVDRPNNGIDENGVGGDLARRGDFAAERFVPARFARRPDVVIIVLESFRADNLEATVDGRPVAPVLRGLIADGAVTGPAYSHNGFTAESLEHLFTGSLTRTGGDSLVDDFAANGYLTACISGEDESFARIEERTGLVRADHFVDARDHVDERTGLSSAPGSLTVSWKVVLRELNVFLAARAGEPRPVFAYFNLQDCHFPYHHDGIDPLLADDPVERTDVTAANAARVRRTYLNTAANVDHAVGRILARWEEARGRRPAFVILADHGESLFEDGVLGHGVELCASQSRIPFLVGGLPVDCVFPLGQSEIRRLLRDALAKEHGTSSRRVDPEKWVFLYNGGLRRPVRIGAARADGAVVRSMRTGRWTGWGDSGLTMPLPALTRLWEQIALHRADRRTAKAATSR